MAADISNITQLIQDFSCETREEAVTVQVLASLLQRITDIIGTTALQTDVSEINTWRKMFTRMSTMLTNITNGSDDRNQVNFSISKGILSSGTSATYLNSLVIRQATTERAGVMRAQQVQDLNKCKSDITAIHSSLNSLNTSLSDINTEMKRISQSASMKQTGTVHIECQFKDRKLFIPGAHQLIEAGLIPVIFRYSIRSSRYGKKVDGRRMYMPKRKGWHRFFDKDKISVQKDDSILFRDDTPQAEMPMYYYLPQYLFTGDYPAFDDISGSLCSVKVPYGQKAFQVLESPKIFKFAIGFYLPVSESHSFTFSELRTNLAIFRVRVCAYKLDTNEYSIYYNPSL